MGCERFEFSGINDSSSFRGSGNFTFFRRLPIPVPVWVTMVGASRCEGDRGMNGLYTGMSKSRVSSAFVDKIP